MGGVRENICGWKGNNLREKPQRWAGKMIQQVKARAAKSNDPNAHDERRDVMSELSSDFCMCRGICVHVPIQIKRCDNFFKLRNNGLFIIRIYNDKE